MPRATVNGIDTHYEVHGSGEPLLFIHGGYGGAASSVGSQREPEVVRIMTGLPVQVITYDRRSAGQSAYVLDSYTQEDIIEDARALLDYLGIEKAIVCGSSAGGPLAIHFALNYPQRVRTLVLACTGSYLMRPRPRTDQFRQLLDEARLRGDHALFESRKETLRNPAPAKNLQHPDREAEEAQRDEATRAALRALSDDDLFRFSTGELRNVEAAFGTDCTDRLGEISVPAIILHGASDGVVPFAWGEALHKAIRDSEFHAIEGANHGVLSWPESGRLVREWVERQLAMVD